jgi:hypothetical protein
MPLFQFYQLQHSLESVISADNGGGTDIWLREAFPEFNLLSLVIQYRS